MRHRDGGWRGAISGVANALTDLFRAEIDELASELRESRRKLVRVLVLAIGALFLAFWWLAILLFSAIEIVGLWLPRWGAALSVAGALTLGLLILWLVLRSAVGRLDSPVETVQRRVENHLLWWNETLGRDPSGPRLEGVDPDEESRPETRSR